MIQSKLQFPPKNKTTIEEVLDKAVAVDGSSFLTISKSDVVKLALKNCNIQNVKIESENTVKKYIYSFCDFAKEEYRKKFQEMKEKQIRFSICTDEWTNPNNLQKYAALTLHSAEETFDLGLKVRLRKIGLITRLVLCAILPVNTLFQLQNTVIYLQAITNSSGSQCIPVSRKFFLDKLSLYKITINYTCLMENPEIIPRDEVNNVRFFLPPRDPRLTCRVLRNILRQEDS